MSTAIGIKSRTSDSGMVEAIPRPLDHGTGSCTRRWLMVGPGLLATFVLVTIGAVTLINLMARQTVRTDSIFPFSGSRLEIDAGLGQVRIERGLPGQIAVTRTASFGLRQPRSQTTIDDDRFTVKDRPCPAQVLLRCEQRWVVAVPPELNVVVTAGSAPVAVSGLAGSVTVSSSGDIDAAGLTGDVSLVSQTGDVRAIGLHSHRAVVATDAGRIEVSFQSEPDLVKARAGRGEVEVEVPDGVAAYRVRAVADDGHESVLVPTDVNSERTINVESGKGNVFVTPRIH